MELCSVGLQKGGMMVKRRFRGFTLTEVLIMVAVIGVIAAVSAVAFNAVKPNKDQAAVVKAFDTISETVNSLANDPKLYPQQDYTDTNKKKSALLNAIAYHEPLFKESSAEVAPIVSKPMTHYLAIASIVGDNKYYDGGRVLVAYSPATRYLALNTNNYYNSSSPHIYPTTMIISLHSTIHSII